MSIRAFYHIYIPNNHRAAFWSVIVDNQMRSIVWDGLAEETKIQCTITMPIYYTDFVPIGGPDWDYNFFANGDVATKINFCEKVVEYITARYPFVEIVEVRDINEPNIYEALTLEKLYQQALTMDNDYILYFHTKGMAHSCMPQTWNWAEALNVHILEQWRKCVEELRLGADIVGCRDYMTDVIGCVSGNIWWVKSEYVKTIQRTPMEFFMEHGQTRMIESWITEGDPKISYVADIGDIHHKYYFIENADENMLC